MRKTERVAHACYTRGHEAGDVACDHCSQSYCCDVCAAWRSQGAKRAELDANGAKVTEAAQSVC